MDLLIYRLLNCHLNNLVGNMIMIGTNWENGRKISRGYRWSGMTIRFTFGKGIKLKRIINFKLWQNTHYFTFKIRILYTCQNLKLKASLGSIFPNNFRDIKFVKFGTWSQEQMCEVMSACVIMHNMIIESERKNPPNDHGPYEYVGPLAHVDHQVPAEFADFLLQRGVTLNRNRPGTTNRGL